MRSLAAFFPGDIIDLLEPAPEDIRFAEVATRLARMPRYAGGTRGPYSVAQHCVAVMECCSRPAQPYALLHGTHVAFTGDTLAPFFRALEVTIGFDGYGRSRLKAALDIVLQPIDRAIHLAAGLNPDVPRSLSDEVKELDACLGGYEIEQLVGIEPEQLNMRRFSTRMILRPWSEAQARKEWLNAFQYVTGTRIE